MLEPPSGAAVLLSSRTGLGASASAQARPATPDPTMATLVRQCWTECPRYASGISFLASAADGQHEFDRPSRTPRDGRVDLDTRLQAHQRTIDVGQRNPLH